MKATRTAFLGAAGAAAAAFAFPNVVLGKGEPIRLGVIPPETGGNALLGQQNREGAEFAVGLINARADKVYDARPFELVVEDATNDNEAAVAAMSRLIAEDVDAIVLPILSTQIQAMAPLVKPSGIPWLTGGTAIKNTQLGLTNLFRCRSSDHITASALTNFTVNELKKSKIAILHRSDAFGNGGADQIEAALAKLGLRPAASEGYPGGATDWTPEFLRFKQAGADAIMLYVQSPGDAALILASYHQQKMGAPIVGSPVLANKTLLETAKGNANGAYAPLEYVPGTKLVNDFTAAFEIQFHHRADIATGSGWVVDAINLLADTYKHNRSTDKARAVATLHATTGWEGITGTFICDAEGNMRHDIGIVQIVNGQPKFVKTVAG